MLGIIFFYIVIFSLLYTITMFGKGDTTKGIISAIISIFSIVLYVFLDKIFSEGNNNQKYNTPDYSHFYNNSGIEDGYIYSDYYKKPTKFISYSQYLRSNEWKQLRDLTLVRANYVCEKCGHVASVVHHKKYPKRFEEDSIDNLVALCKNCHNLIHNEMNPPKFS